MEAVLKLLAGAVAGGAFGYLFSRVRTCSSRACNVRTTAIFSIVGWAVFGAAVVWYFLKR